MLLETQHPKNKSIMASVLGQPNAGKSSLINCLLGQDLSIVTSKEQTTRNKFHCVLTVDYAEIILVDTPGVHNASKEINKRMNEQAVEGSEGVDLNLMLVDLSRDLGAQLRSLRDHFNKPLGPTWLILTKSDLLQTRTEKLPLDKVLELSKEFFPSIERCLPVSSKNGENMHLLIGALCDAAIPGPHLYPKGDLSNKNMRFFAAEYVREQAFEMLREELPYELAVVIDSFAHEKEEKVLTSISATIMVNRPGQRAIVIGTKGSMIKEIGTRARHKLEALIGNTVSLNLHVKISPKWFKNHFVLDEIGLPRAQNSARVWRQQ